MLSLYEDALNQYLSLRTLWVAVSIMQVSCQKDIMVLLSKNKKKEKEWFKEEEKYYKRKACKVKIRSRSKAPENG